MVTNGRPVACVLYAPALDELFVAETHGPALKNGKQISVSNADEQAVQRLATAEEMLTGFEPDFRKTVERVTIRWPDGSSQDVPDVTVDQLLTIEQAK